jgi:hypothetical protein
MGKFALLQQASPDIKIKAYLTQSQTGTGGNVCLALVERWIQSGYVEDAADRKKARQGLRDPLLQKELPVGIADRQKEIEKQFERLQGAELSTMFSVITNMQYSATRSLGPLKRDFTLQFGVSVAQGLMNCEQTTYFHLSLRRSQPGPGHVVGLKRGKNRQDGQSPRYSLFDANFLEINGITQASLPMFLSTYAKEFLSDFSQYALFRVTPVPTPQPQEDRDADEMEAGLSSMRGMGNPDDWGL